MKTWMGRVGLLLAIVVVLAAGVAPWAQGQTEPVTYHACVSNAKGVMRLVSEGQQCSKNEHLIDWNRVGPAGECTCPFTLAEFQALEARVAALEGEPDADGDGWPASVDCDDDDSAIYPGAVELCDGKDNDCDGLVDEDCPFCVPGRTQACYPGPAGSVGLGVCKAGIQTCDAEGQWGSCTGAVVPSDSDADCDGLDNDCDGETDEEWRSEPCNTGLLGVCAQGITVCSAGGWFCGQQVLPEDEICGDGLDNDCDGETDEGCS